jgi:hypothetical protein
MHVMTVMTVLVSFKELAGSRDNRSSAMEDVQDKATAAGMEALREWLALRRQLPFYDALIQVRSLFHCLVLILFPAVRRDRRRRSSAFGGDGL